jgi:hypothetical protein
VDDDPFDALPPRQRFGLAQLVLVAILALGAGAGTAWLLTRGTLQTAVIPQPVQQIALAPSANVLAVAPRITVAPRLTAPEAVLPTPPAPLARRDLAVGPAAAPIPVTPRSSRAGAGNGTNETGSSAAPLPVVDVPPPPGADERALAPPPQASMPLPPPTQLLVPAPATAPAQVPANVGPCERYTTEMVIDGRRLQRTGTACQQPDGTWRIQAEP